MFSRSQNFRFGLRVTAAILLAVIAWGSTVEVTHGHTDTSLNAQAARNCIESSAEATPPTSVQQNAPARSSSRQNASSECLICQLHHNLTMTLLTQPATVDQLQSQAARSLAPAPIHILEFAIAQPGRAPPAFL